ncbi:hypothetical protein BDF14DRAFT_1726947 [Spinellus fusiger]|nr:hypothetical protein BDF14DRAFT_1726947 [Spinellus fusiger]
MGKLHTRLSGVVPTRSNYTMSTSVTMENLEMEEASVAGAGAGTAGAEEEDGQQPHILHPLRAAKEDLSAYENTVEECHTQLRAIEAAMEDLFCFHHETQWQDHPYVIKRCQELDMAFKTLEQDMATSDNQLKGFRRGYWFGRHCSDIREALGVVQAKMLTVTTTDTDIQELETRVKKTSQDIVELKKEYSDLLLKRKEEKEGEGEGEGEGEEEEGEDKDEDEKKEKEAYTLRWDAIAKKNALVCSWVEEVRIWFAEAERIRQWIQIRIERLGETVVPNALEVPMKVSHAAVEELNTQHAGLEQEIEAFDKEDMARLRSHVKDLTGAGRVGKDLSPADTTTIEITLSTLMALDKLMHSLRRKSFDLQVLTRRDTWEKEVGTTMAWLEKTHQQVEEFKASARWQVAEAEAEAEALGGESTAESTAESIETQREEVIQYLLMLEQNINTFDQGQFTSTVNRFQDLEDSVHDAVPDHLEERQRQCESQFEDLYKHIGFARQIVEQRLSITDFVHHTHLVKQDALQIQLDIIEAEKTHTGAYELAESVQSIHERILQLATTATSRIVYPEAVGRDQQENERLNQGIQQEIESKRDELILLAEHLDTQLNSLCHGLELHRESQALVADVHGLCDWVEDRTKDIHTTDLGLHLTLEDLNRLEAEHAKLVQVIEEEKEDEAADLLIRIQTLLETAEEVDSAIVDRPVLETETQKLKEKFDGLRHTLEEREAHLQSLRKTMEDGNNFIKRANALRSFAHTTCTSIPGLKQTYGFMTGQSEQQDKQRFDQLKAMLDELKSTCEEKQNDYEEIYQQLHQTQHRDDDESVQLQAALDQDWKQLRQEMEHLDKFTEIVGQWYERQRRMSIVDEEYLEDLQQEITQLASTGWSNTDFVKVEKRLSKAVQMLGKHPITMTALDLKEDAVQTANYSCARDRHASLLNKAQAILVRMNGLKKNANNAIAFGDFLESTSELLKAVEREVVASKERIEHVKDTRFETLEKKDIEQLMKSLQTESSASEIKGLELRQKLKDAWEDAQRLKRQGYEEQSVKKPLNAIEKMLVQLFNDLGAEKRQAGFVRKLQMQAKTAEELMLWIQHCSHAIAQLPTDVCITEEIELHAGIDNLAHKIQAMQPIVTGFQNMKPRILGKESHPHLEDFCLSTQRITGAVEHREKTVLEAWHTLEQQLKDTRQSIEHSRSGVEIARKVKEILTLVGETKERAGAVRICHIKPHELDKESDLKIIQTCSLSMLPTEQETDLAKQELDAIDSDIECQLQGAMNALDGMLESSAKNEDIFASQRTEIIDAVKGLTGLMKIKREAIREAKKMEDFLTVVEELEVLLSAVAEVVDRASPEGARLVGSVLSRADLQAILIELDTRYRYYEPKINALMEEAHQVALHLMQDPRVVHCLESMMTHWTDLQALSAAKKAELLACIGPLADPFTLSSLRLEERGQRATMRRLPQSTRPHETIKPQPMHSMPRFMAPTGNARTRTSSNNVSPAAKRVAQRTVGLQKRAVKTPDVYVADPKNDLDVALGLIVNDSPYKITVKMVPGEVGRYWFGSVNPKLAYCRILRSGMVMVRVGGGWVELSQFLRDHALLECGNFVPRAQETSKRVLLGEGFLRTGRAKSPHAVLASDKSSPFTLRESQSTPYHRGASPIAYGHGVKEGNKFLVTVDGMGNQVEVKMRRANAKDSKFTTPRHILG